MPQFDAMFGPHRRTSATHATATITFMGLHDVKEAEIDITAESATLPDTTVPATKLTLRVTPAGHTLTKTLFGPPAEDCLELLFQMYMSPSDHLVNNVFTPFIRAVCIALDRPMIQVAKPE